MRTRTFLFSLVAILATAGVASAADSVRTGDKTLAGTIKGFSKTAVTIEVSGLEKEVPVNEVDVVFFDGEPSALKSARANIANHAYQNALEALERVNDNAITSPNMQQEVDYLRALATARLALQGNGDIKDAGSQMIAFARQYPDSYHYFDAAETIGDLLVALGMHSQAEQYYQRLAEAPWPEYKMRAGVAIGRTRLAQGNAAEAAKAFDAVLAMNAGTPAAQAQQLAAKIGKAEVLAESDQPDEAVALVNEVIEKADAEDAALHALAYNVLGTAHRKAGRPKDAVLAFLHVDTLFFQDGNAHARALANLAELWDAEGIRKPDKAAQAKELLQTRYGNSRWAKQLQ